MTVQITDFDSSGRGVGEILRLDGLVRSIAVPGTIVGETVVVDPIFKDPKGVCRYEGRLAKCLSESSDRTIPLCPHFGQCGGCSWQHISYERQLSNKQTAIDRLFSPLLTEDVIKHPIIGSPSLWKYRNKMEFSFSQDKEGKPFLGLFKGSGRRGVENIHVCPLAGPIASSILDETRKWWMDTQLLAYRPSSNSGSLMTITVRESATTGDCMVILTVSGNPEFALQQHHLDGFVAAMQRAAHPKGTLSVILRIRQIAKKMPTQFYEMILAGPDHIREIVDVEPISGKPCSLEIHISPQSFFQPNTLQAMTIYSRALQMAQLQPKDIFWDLYCGIGVFGMAASTVVAKAIGVELSAESSYDAKTNASRLGLSCFSVVCGDVASTVASSPSFCEKPSKILVDPPRSGLTPQAINQIISLEPDRLIYVSCNPETQARDVAAFLREGWSVREMQAVDQFPQTAHVEHILCLDTV